MVQCNTLDESCLQMSMRWGEFEEKQATRCELLAPTDFLLSSYEAKPAFAVPEQVDVKKEDDTLRYIHINRGYTHWFCSTFCPPMIMPTHHRTCFWAFRCVFNMVQIGSLGLCHQLLVYNGLY